MKIRIIAWMDKSKQKDTRENQNFSVDRQRITIHAILH